MKFSFRKPKAESAEISAEKKPVIKKTAFKFSFKKPKNNVDSETITPEIPSVDSALEPVKAKFSFGKLKPSSDKPKKIKVEKIKGEIINKEKLPKLPKAQMPVKSKRPSFVRKARFTLLVGDEGTILIHMKGSRVLTRQFVPDASESNLAELRETIEKDNLAPITLIIDSLDQAFVQQTLPPVSSMSVQKLIKRRLDRDFKPEDIKGAIVLGKEKTGRKDWNFLMISVDKSPQITLWLDFIMSFQNRFRGIVLLSVEAEIFIKKLDRAIGGIKIAPLPEWKFIVSHNKVGGFRQIILRNGRLIFTRLAQPVGEPTPEVIAGNIEQEMVTTIEYLKRFGFDSRNGLEVYIIASDPVTKILDTKRFDAVVAHVMTPFKVAEYLGIDGATQPNDQFGDVIMAAAIGGSSQNTLKLTTVESRQYDSIQKLKYGQRLFGTFLILGLIVYGATLGYATLLLNSDVEDFQQKIRLSEQGLQKAKEKVVESKIDIETVTDKIELFKATKEQKRSPLPTLTLVAAAIKPPIIIKSYHWQMGDKVKWPTGATAPLLVSDPATQITGVPAVVPEPVTITLEVEFPAGLKNAAMYKKFSEDTMKEIQAALKGYTILFSDAPKEYLDSDNLQIVFDNGSNVASTIGLKPLPMQITVFGAYVPMIAGVEEP